MTLEQIYASKRLTAAEAADQVESGHRLAMGMALAEPPAILTAIAARAEAQEIDEVRLYYFHSTPHAAMSVLRYELMDRIRPHCFFLGPVERALLARGEADGRRTIAFMPGAFSQAPRLMRELAPVAVCVTAVSALERHGDFSLGTTNAYGAALGRSAGKVIVEVNKHMPRVRGGMIHVSEIDGIVENDQPLFENPSRERSAEHDAIGLELRAPA